MADDNAGLGVVFVLIFAAFVGSGLTLIVVGRRSVGGKPAPARGS